MRIVITILFTMCLLAINAQPPNYKNLVLEGGGVRGFAYVGALEVLDSLGVLKNIERTAGTSAGAIHATMLAVGFTPKEIRGLIEDLPLKQFNDGSIAGGLSRLRYNYGFFKGQKLNEWIGEMIRQKTGNANITFRELHEQKAEKNYKDVYITGTDISYRCLRIFSYETYPDMRIKDAVRISFSIPLYFEPVIMNDSGKLLNDKNNRSGHVMVDGGLLSNYPVKIFDSAKYFPCDSAVSNCRNHQTLGLLLETPEQLGYSLHTSATESIESLTEYIKAMYQTAIDKPNPDEADLKRTITISDQGIKSRVRKLSSKEINKLVESGRQAVRDFMKN